MRPIDTLIIHCSASSFGDVETIRDWHVRERGWNDIGYHFVILNGYRAKKDEYDAELDGRIEEGRPVEIPGAHCVGMNKSSIGICLIGVDAFTEPQMSSLIDLIHALQSQYEILADNVIGHYETPSGKAQGKTCPCFDVSMLRIAL